MLTKGCERTFLSVAQFSDAKKKLQPKQLEPSIRIQQFENEAISAAPLRNRDAGRTRLLYYAESLHGLCDALKARDIGAEHVVARHAVFLRGFRTAIVNIPHDVG